MQFNERFKKSMVQKLLTPGGKGITELSKEIGVCAQTLYNWRDKYSHGEDDCTIQKRSPRHWRAKDKYNALLEAAGLSGNALGRWLREKGLHSNHLSLWAKEIEQMVSSPKDKEEIKKLRKRNKELERELIRKEKALAEVAALLTLKKKANLIWGDGEK